MPDPISEYVEFEPYRVTAGLDVTHEERERIADSLSAERGEWVIGALRSELETRWLQADERVTTLTAALGSATAELAFIDSALGLTAPAEKSEPITESDILSRYLQLTAMHPEDFLESLADEPAFDLTVYPDSVRPKIWTELHGSRIGRVFGSADKSKFTRALNCVSRVATHLPALEQAGIVSNATVKLSENPAFNNDRVLSLRIEKPADFLKYAIENVTNFGETCAPSIITIADFQRLDASQS